MSGTSHILIVDDSPTQLVQMQIALHQDGFEVKSVPDGQSALASIAESQPIVVVTDLQMPGMSGLELVETLRGTHPSIPVVLTTSDGSEDIAAEALRRGAASYVPKRDINTTLAPVLRQVLSISEAERSVREVAKYTVGTKLELALASEESLVPSVIARLELVLVELDLFDEGSRMQIAMALDEALINAIVHGNLEVSSELRSVSDGSGYQDKIAQQKADCTFGERRVHVTLSADREQATFVIRDEGPGFDSSSVSDPTDMENLEAASGRGLFMIHAFMDEVRHNDVGNEIVLIKRKGNDDESEDDGDHYGEAE